MDLDAGLVRVTATLQEVVEDGTRRLVFLEPKTSRSRRTVSLPGFALEALRAHRREQAERRLLLGAAWRDLDLVVERGDGSPWRPATLSRAWRRLADTAGLAGVRFHDLRHAHATLMLASGVHPKVVADRLGHATVSITLDTYSHVIPALQAEAARVLDGVLAQ